MQLIVFLRVAETDYLFLRGIIIIRIQSVSITFILPKATSFNCVETSHNITCAVVYSHNRFIETKQLAGFD